MHTPEAMSLIIDVIVYLDLKWIKYEILTSSDILNVYSPEIKHTCPSIIWHRDTKICMISAKTLKQCRSKGLGKLHKSD